jgi:hypothetical protein
MKQSIVDKVGVGGSVMASAIVHDGTIYVGACDGNMYALDLDGTEKWRFSSGGPITYPASCHDGLLFFGLLYTPLEVLVSIGLQMLSRHNEYQADRFAADTADEPRSLTDALKKLSTGNLSNLTPHPFYSGFYYSHPTLPEREHALLKVCGGWPDRPPGREATHKA